jgi:hypothetical protein
MTAATDADSTTARLRQAAALVRQRATDATPGPWDRPLNTRRKSSVRAPLPEGERGEWIGGTDPSTGKREHCTVATIPTWEGTGKFARERGGRDLEWIALMHPVVGEALARLLETEAASNAGDEDHAGCTAETCATAAALALADAILAAVSP